jgi:hypothetical protein
MLKDKLEKKIKKDKKLYDLTWVNLPNSKLGP